MLQCRAAVAVFCVSPGTVLQQTLSGNTFTLSTKYLIVTSGIFIMFIAFNCALIIHIITFLVGLSLFHKILEL